ncbi:MAG TPA: hypothetical protein VF672_13395 [Pseudomonas sp.]
MNESAEHEIVLDGKYVGAVNAGGSHWRLRLILKPAIIQDCARRGNAGLPVRYASSRLPALGLGNARNLGSTQNP